MKFVKRLIVAILILGITLTLCRGWLYRHLISYKSLGERTNYMATTTELIKYIEANANDNRNIDIKNIIKLSLAITSKKLYFSGANTSNNPNNLIHSKAAHCVGYAAFFSTTCNYLLKKYNLKNTWTAKPQIGQLYLLGINVHQYFNSPFFKDHDFVIIKNKVTGKKLAVDPTISDYFKITFVKYSK